MQKLLNFYSIITEKCLKGVFEGAIFPFTRKNCQWYTGKTENRKPADVSMAGKDL